MNKLFGWLGRLFGKPLSHEEVHELASGYIEDDLTTSVKKRFQRHIASCKDCNYFVATFRATVLTLRDLPRKEHEPDLPDRIKARLKTDTETDPPGGVPE